MVKNLIKSIVTFVVAKLNAVKCGRGAYIGLGVKFVSRGKVRIEKGSVIRPLCRLYTSFNNSEIVLGEGTEIGEMSTISSANRVAFGKYVLTGPHVYVADHNHEYEDINVPICHQGIRCNNNDSVTIGDGTWIGTNVVIAGNVKIGKNCVIGANSVVTKDIPDYSVAVGAPCVVVKYFDVAENKWKKG